MNLLTEGSRLLLRFMKHFADAASVVRDENDNDMNLWFCTEY